MHRLWDLWWRVRRVVDWLSWLLKLAPTNLCFVGLVCVIGSLVASLRDSNVVVRSLTLLHLPLVLIRVAVLAGLKLVVLYARISWWVITTAKIVILVLGRTSTILSSSAIMGL